MDFAKDEIFSIKYKGENYEKSKKIKNFFIKNKIILTLLNIGLAVCLINCVLIYNFIKVLSTL